jgi:phosphatidylglycerol:prolipoprotein diacylglycerol transferase
MWPIDFFHSYLPSPVVVELGGISLHWYGCLMALGIGVGYALTRKLWQCQRWVEHELDSLIIWLVAAGLIGARLFDIFIYEWWYFKDHLNQVFFIWQGGLAWHGGLFGAAMALWWWNRRKKYDWRQLLGTFAPGLAAGQAIGRWGNYFNQELFGLPTDLPWGIPISEINRPFDYLSANYFHPIFLYESVALFLIAYLLWRLVWQRGASGRWFALYLILTGAVRFILEFLRLDEQNVYFGVRAGVLVACLTIIIGIWLAYLSRPGKPPVNSLV